MHVYLSVKTIQFRWIRRWIWSRPSSTTIHLTTNSDGYDDACGEDPPQLELYLEHNSDGYGDGCGVDPSTAINPLSMNRPIPHNSDENGYGVGPSTMTTH